MFGMSMTEILVILAAILVFLGPDKIPEAARTVGKVLREVRKASNLLRDAVNLDEVTKGVSKTSKKVVSDFDKEMMEDPDPKKNVRIVEMTRRNKPNGAIKQIPLSMAQPELPHREIYLHVPYEETI